MSVVVESPRPTSVGATPSVADRVGVVVSVHDTDRARLHRCLASLRRSDPTAAIVVVDNSGSTEPLGSTDVAHVVTTNRGFGAAINDGASTVPVAHREFIVALNDDVEVDAGWLVPLVEALDADPSLGAVQPKLLLADTDPLLVNSLGVEFDEHGAGRDIGYRTLDDPTAAEPREIEAFSGGAAVLRRSFFDDLGGFDERYFLYYEDVDLALRGAERGWRYACVPTSTVAHAKGATTDETADDARRLQERNRIVVAARFFAPTTVGRALWMSVRRLRHQPHAAHLRALAGGLVRMPRAFVERRRAGRNAVDVATPTGGNAR